MEIGILDSYPELRDEAVRYCALVSRDRSNPRRRTALGGNGMQWLELRSNVCGTVTTVENFPIKREPSSSLEWPSVRKVARSARTPCYGSDGEIR